MKTMEFNLESVSAVGENPLTHSQRWLFFFFCLVLIERDLAFLANTSYKAESCGSIPFFITSWIRDLVTFSMKLVFILFHQMQLGS